MGWGGKHDIGQTIFDLTWGMGVIQLFGPFLVGEYIYIHMSH